MLTSEEINKIIENEISEDEKLGEQSSGSGHLAFVSFKLESIETKPIENNQLEVHYNYVLSVETEFTYYPDNPPQEYHKSKIVILNSNGEIIGKREPEGNKQYVQSDDSNNPFTWIDEQTNINNYLAEILHKIEWHYGEGRAPFIYPPIYDDFVGKDNKLMYRCIVKFDSDYDEEIIFQSVNPTEILKKIKYDFDKRFLSFE